MQSTLRYLRNLLCLGSMLFGGLLNAQTVSLVQSDKTEAFQAASEALVAELVGKGQSRAEIRSMYAGDPEASMPAPESVRVVVTLGTAALRTVLARPGRAPLVIATLLPKLGYERVLADFGRRPGSHVAAVYLDQPIGRQLDLLRLALPKTRTLGVVWGPESVSQQAALLSAAQSRDIALATGFVTPTTALGAALRAALIDADAFIAVPDGQVFNSNTVSNMLITTYRARVPVIAFSPSYVRAGALLSVHTTPVQAGTQAGTVVKRYLQSGVAPESQYPQEFEVTVNELVARSLGLSLDASVLRERLKALEKRP